MTTSFNDIKCSLRQLVKSPGFTAVAVISLALGIGANTALFSLANGILLRSLPVPNPHELRVINWSAVNPRPAGLYMGEIGGGGTNRQWLSSFTYPLFTALREQCDSRADIFGYSPICGATVRGRREAFKSEGLMVSDNFFAGLGVRPLLGRLIGPEDEQADAAPAAVISHGCWERQFDLDPSALGQAFTLNSHAFTIIGVLPAGFPGIHPGAKTEFYVSMSAQPMLLASCSRSSSEAWWVQIMGRLNPSVSDRQLQAALDVAFVNGAKAIMEETKTTMEQPGIVVTDGHAGPDSYKSDYRKPLRVLLSVVGMVQLLACVNLAGLLLSRGAARQREFAVRTAVGAGRWRLMKQLLTENLVLALLGGGFGLPIALWGKGIVARLLAGSPEGLHYDTSLDLTVLGFTLGIALVTALLSGLLPALRAAAVHPASSLKDRASSGGPRLRVGRFLVVGQVALSVLLLVGAGLYVRTLVNLVRINPGFATENLLLFRLDPGKANYPRPQIAALYDDLQQSLGAIPGVQSATFSQAALLAQQMSGGCWFRLQDHHVEGQEKAGGYGLRAGRLVVSETFFATMGVPVLLGRGLDAGDIDGAARAVVINDAFAREYLPGENPIGQTLNAPGTDWQIVGVCRDTRYVDIKYEAPPTVYFSFRQDNGIDGIGSAYFALRTMLPPMSIVPSVRKAVAAINPDVPLSEIATQEQVRDRGIAKERTFATLCGALALLAVLLSCIGLYGLMAYNVARRTGEIGIRMALGATRRNIAGPILREALLLGTFGIAAGLPASLALTRFIKSQLYGVTPTDPFTLAGGCFILIAAVLLAAWVPARRAAKVDPMAALKCE